MIELVHSALAFLGIACGLVLVLSAALALLVIPALEGFALLMELLGAFCAKVEHWRERCGSG